MLKIKSVKKLAIATMVFSTLAGCHSFDSSVETRLAKLEAQQQQDQVLLHEVTRRIGLGELVRPTSLSFENAAIEGKLDAPVVLMEFTDLHCPYCKEFNDTIWPEIEEQYVATGKMVLVAHDFPLVSLHPRAGFAALALRCASEQADYSKVKQSLFEMKAAQEEQFAQLEQDYNLDSEKFRSCMKDPAMQTKVNSSVKVGRDMGIKSTPTFLLGRNENGKLVDFEVITGAKDSAFFIEKIEAILAK
ncbi:DsbA family protein [Shewanella algidipiscicola]|uniref:DsbA family protein n=1 Tax=Shewanella algidipiscicola TaxID=614070 RepID=UPI000D78508A|nr:thioredoxin domain-containing protein [Shewanella algidipiscicola]